MNITKRPIFPSRQIADFHYRTPPAWRRSYPVPAPPKSQIIIPVNSVILFSNTTGYRLIIFPRNPYKTPIARHHSLPIGAKSISIRSRHFCHIYRTCSRRPAILLTSATNNRIRHVYLIIPVHVQQCARSPFTVSSHRHLTITPSFPIIPRHTNSPITIGITFSYYCRRAFSPRRLIP